MLVLLEGIDGSGKSTCAYELKRRFRAQGDTAYYIHRGVPERNVLEEYQLDIEAYRPGHGASIVGDRWHWGDLVYGELYRGKSYLGVSGFRYVELFLLSRGAITVLVEQSRDEIYRRLVERGEDYLKLSDIDWVLEKYRDVALQSATHVLTTSDPDSDEILKHAAFWSGYTEDLTPFPTYIGGRTPRVLLVGDRRSDSSGPSMTAFRPSPTMNGSGAYLLNALAADLWKDVGICNANEESDVRALWDVLSGPPIIALGHEASKALRRLDLEHSAVPHPAKIVRFHRKEQSSYGQLILDQIGTNEKRFSWPR